MDPHRESGTASLFAVDVLEVDHIPTTVHGQNLCVTVFEFATHNLYLVILSDWHRFDSIFVLEFNRKGGAHDLSSHGRWCAEWALRHFRLEDETLGLNFIISLAY